MLLNEEHKLVQQTAERLAAGSIRPFSKEWDKQKQFPMQAIEALAKAGFMGMLIPTQWGGAGMDHLAYALAIIEIAKADGGLSTIVGVHNSVACLPILRYGTDEQKKTFLIPLAKGETLGAFCLTEPEAGSDAKALRCQARQEGDYFILNGIKQFITSGNQADVALVFAKLGDNIAAFIVPTLTPGYQVAKIENKMGQHSAQTAQIVLDNLRIPLTALLGKPNEGYKIALSNLECGRLGIAAQAIGMAEEAFNLSVGYAKERSTFGKLLCEHQAISFKLADMATQLEAAKQLLFHAITLRDQELPCLKEASMAKLFATEAAERICREAIQIYGGYGYIDDFPLEKIYRDVRVTTIYEGTSEIQRMIIGRALI
jgi:butyryl-CoA dehydrogenase